jgi:chemotaxis protein MotB
MSRRRHDSHPPHEEHADETWLVPYSDVLTLLLALFIVLFASAQVDQKKLEQLAESFSNAFRGNTSVFESTRTVPQPTEGAPRTADPSPSFVSALANERASGFQKETAQLLEAKRLLDKYIDENSLKDTLGTALVEEGLLVRIKDSALFNSGSAELLPTSRALGGTLANMLAALPQQVVVSGHTDNVPINTYEFPTNWDLSAKRAVNFTKYLLAANPALRPDRFSANGNGEYRPAAPNTTPEGRAQNRRVEILIVRKHSS